MDAYIHEVLFDEEQRTMTILFSGCNFKCRYCNTPELTEFITEEMISLRDVKKQILETKPKKIIFTGGEPLMQRAALLEILRMAKAQKIMTILETNLSKPKIIELLLEQELVSEYKVDLKATEALFSKVTNSATFFMPSENIYWEFIEALRLLEQNQDKANIVFQTIITPGLLYKKEDLFELAKLIEGFDSEWILKAFEKEKVLDKSLKGVERPTYKFIENLIDMIRKEHPSLRISLGM